MIEGRGGIRLVDSPSTVRLYVRNEPACATIFLGDLSARVSKIRVGFLEPGETPRFQHIPLGKV
jgi:hypothetical protein